MLYVYRRLMDINVYVQVLFIQVHYVKLIKIHVNILRVKMVFVNYGEIQVHFVVFAIRDIRDNFVI